MSNSAGIIDVKTDEEIIQQADFIFSILVPSEATSAAQRFAPLLNKNKHIIYVDMNAIAPQTVLSIASLFPHGNFVDGCIIGLPPGSLERIPTLYLSGEHAQKIADLYQLLSNENRPAQKHAKCHWLALFPAPFSISQRSVADRPHADCR